MGCGASQPPKAQDGTYAEQRESYTKTLMSPGGTITHAQGFCIDRTLPAKTPGGSSAERRDYDRDPLSFEEVLAIEAARERGRELAKTPKRLKSNWRKQVLQTDTPSTPAAHDDGSGRREIRIPLPDDAEGGDELVVETPRGTLVDVVVPDSIAPIRGPHGQQTAKRSMVVLYHPNPHAAMASDDSPGTPATPVTLMSPTGAAAAAKERRAKERLQRQQTVEEEGPAPLHLSPAEQQQTPPGEGGLLLRLNTGAEDGSP